MIFVSEKQLPGAAGSNTFESCMVELELFWDRNSKTKGCEMLKICVELQGNVDFDCN